MTSGGARARSGPPPDPDALRRDRDRGEWIVLRPRAADATVPAWPLTRPTAREKALWAREWSRPQANEWERLGLETEVAMYVRLMAEAERPKARTEARNLLMRAQEHLGVSIPGMARNKWRMPTDVAAASTPDRPARRGSDTKERMLHVIEGGTAS